MSEQTQSSQKPDGDLVRAADRVWAAFLAFGPVDGSRPEGVEFEDALIDLAARVDIAKEKAGAA